MGQTPILLAERAGEAGDRTRRSLGRHVWYGRFFRCRQDNTVSVAGRHRVTDGVRQDRVHGRRRVRPGCSGVTAGLAAAGHRSAPHFLRRRSARHRRRGARACPAPGDEVERRIRRRHSEDGCGQSPTDCLRRDDRFRRGAAVGGARTARWHVPLGSLGPQPSAADNRRIDRRSDRLAPALSGLWPQRLRRLAHLRGARRQRQPHPARRGALRAAVSPDAASRPPVPGSPVGARTVATWFPARGDVRDAAAGLGGRLPG